MMIHKPSQIYPNPVLKSKKKKVKKAAETIKKQRNPAVLLKQAKVLLKTMLEFSCQKQPLNTQSELECLRKAAEINSYLSVLSLEFVPYLAGPLEIKAFVNLFTKVTQNKEIFVCLISKGIEAWVYGLIGNQNCEDGQVFSNENRKQILKILNNFVNLCQFWFQMNQNRDCVVYCALIEGLNTICKWVKLYQKYKEVGYKVDKLLQQIKH